jgi:predicted nucleotidyltransferase
MLQSPAGDMNQPLLDAARDLPDPVARTLTLFVTAAENHLGASLRSIILFGSAAENRLRATSDVNLLVVLTVFDRSQVEGLSETLAAANAAIRLNVMWLLESEIGAAVEAFSVKFADILRRRRVLRGSDPFQALAIPRHAAIARLRQVLLNLVLRLRASYALDSQREERLMVLLADTAGPLRASAAEILELESGQRLPPREAIEQMARTLPGEGWPQVLEAVTEARHNRTLPAGTTAPMLVKTIDLANHLLRRAMALESR